MRVRRNLFYRYFGLGPDTTPEGESSYTRLFAIASARFGWNVIRNLNVAAFGEIRGNRPELHAIEACPRRRCLYPDAPGLDGAALLRQGLALRYDTREHGDYTATGFASELSATWPKGSSAPASSPRSSGTARVLVPETSWLQGAARVYWRQLISGGTTCRSTTRRAWAASSCFGVSRDRFIDMGAWEVEVEQRIRLFQTHIFGVVADWRIDPFVAAGQVYGTTRALGRTSASRPGAGLRMWVNPNILGRVDLAYAGEGLRAYVVLGYPY